MMRGLQNEINITKVILASCTEEISGCGRKKMIRSQAKLPIIYPAKSNKQKECTGEGHTLFV